MSKNFLFFSPHSSITLHSLPEALLANLTKEIATVTYLQCDGILSSWCTTFDAFKKNPSKDKLQVCRRCKKSQKMITDSIAVPSLNLEQFISQRELVEIDKSISNLSDIDFISFNYQDIPVGSNCYYETILKWKKSTISFSSNDQKAYYLSFLRNSCVIVKALTRILEKNQYSHLFVYNALYSENRTAIQTAKNFGLKVYCLHAGPNAAHRLSTINLSKENQLDHEKVILNLWQLHKENPVSKSTVKLIRDHLSVMFKASFWLQYGRKANRKNNIRKIYDIPYGSPIFLATLSSNDERFAARVIGAGSKVPENILFETQADWIKFLVSYFKQLPDRYLVVRIHPRDYPNPRYPNISDSAKDLLVLSENLPKNVIFNSPDEGLSIYDFASETSVLLNNYSSAGREFAALGIPVVAFCKDIHTFTTDFCFLGENEKEYKNAIENAYQDGWSVERVKTVFRWYSLEHFYSTVQLNLSYSFSSREIRSKYSFQNIINKLFLSIGSDFIHKMELKDSLLRNTRNNKLIDFLNNDFFSPAEVLENLSSEKEESESIRDYLNWLLKESFIRNVKNSKLHTNIKEYLLFQDD